MNETFYGGFYGFESAPFHVTPDPTLLFPTETHRAALGAIEYGIQAGKGFIAVTGEVGVGKTTVLRVCLDGLDASKYKIIYLFSPALTTAELYATILEDFDVTLPSTSNTGDMLRVLQRTLLAIHQSGMQVVLAVDEAQQMPEATLESLRILSNLETEKSKLLQIILVGQPELDQVLAKHSMRQLAQRIAVRARVKSLTFRQSCRYVVHRTRCAGRLASRPLFTTPALLYVAFAAGGIPRTINICCDNALINGYGHAAERITFGIVREACKSMKFRSPLRRVAAGAAVLLVLVGLFATGNTLLRHFYAARAEPVPSVAQPALPAPAEKAVPGPSLEKRAGGAPTAEPAGGDPSPADSEGRNDASAAAEGAGAGESAARDAPPAANLGTATPPDRAGAATPGAATPGAATPGAATPGVATPAVATLAAARDGAPKPSTTGQAPAAAAPAPSEPPPALRPVPANAASAAPLPWIASDDASTGPTRATSRATSKWLVREGDTVYKACMATYGSCDPRTLHEVLAENPRLGRDATIHPGEILVLRKHAPGSN
jgi:general secretion pathway protein A